MKNINIGKEPVDSYVMMIEEKDGTVSSYGILEYESEEGVTVVRILTAERELGIEAEQSFIDDKFPGYKVIKKSLLTVSIGDRSVKCDCLRISNEKEEKDIYFEISEFSE